MSNEDSFIKKIDEEIQKRREIMAKADDIVQSIEQHYQERKKELETIDVEKTELLNQIHEVVKQKDARKLEILLERLR